jgi:hypothetical protein
VKADAKAAVLRVFAAVILHWWRRLKYAHCREEESGGCCGKTNKQQPRQHEPINTRMAAWWISVCQRSGRSRLTVGERAYIYTEIGTESQKWFEF